MPLEFAKDKNAFVVAELKELPATLDMLMEAVGAGELDEQLTAVAAERGHMFKRAR